MSLPIRVVILEPADKPWPMPLAVRGKVAEYIRKLQLWMQAEINCTFDYQLYWHRSTQTHEWLSLELKHDGTTKDWRDETGRGADEAKVMRVLRDELGLPDDHFRWAVIMHYGGGWAGGRNNQPDEDAGQMLIGDWNILGCLRRDNTAEMISDGYAFSHEFAHMLGLSIHPEAKYHADGSVWLSNTLPDGTTVPSYLEPLRNGNLCVGQKMELLGKNYRFLRDV